jgi:hypothetical protein
LPFGIDKLFANRMSHQTFPITCTHGACAATVQRLRFTLSYTAAVSYAEFHMRAIPQYIISSSDDDGYNYHDHTSTARGCK